MSKKPEKTYREPRVNVVVKGKDPEKASDAGFARGLDKALAASTKKDESMNIKKLVDSLVEGYYDDDWDEDYAREMEFEDPGGRSALRRATKGNPRNLPCPTCKQPNRLTRKDKALGYQCDACADAAEGGGW